MSRVQNLVVVGLQWGDEGKGKIVDVLSENFDMVVRFQGGSNAGHTVKIGENIFKFRLMPTGAVRGKKSVIGNGVVVDPIILNNEMEQLRKAGLEIDVVISDRAHLITPYHILIDELQETERGNLLVGTTKRGIGPTYADKVTRIGIRACDIANIGNTSEWRKFEKSSESKINRLYNSTVDATTSTQLKEFKDILLKIIPLIGDCSELLNSAIDSGKRVLFEGAQGTLLDIDHGTYPFVTSSNCVSAAAAIGTGISPNKLDSILGIAKAYLTRVGTGPFPTELNDSIGQMIRDKGAEYGTVTGRSRRCGWLDLVALRYAAKLNGAKYLAITKVDVLNGINPLKVCVAYDIDGSEVTTIPASSSAYACAQPVYEEIEGWSELPQNIMDPDIFRILPDSLHSYIKMIETWAKSKVVILSLGPDRAETIVVPGIFPSGSIHV
ncbi:MAG: adenylosuccinate synthase [Candidatus Thorarchaeota archaeon]|nr:adenylosuccinate synthase [Candidatus Thorarchaeota archaeon]